MIFYNDKLLVKKKRKKIFSIALPIIISMVVTQAQMLTDSVFLGRVDSDFFAALGNVFFPYFLSISFLWSLPIGTSVLISQHMGAKDPAKAKIVAESSLKFNTFFSILMFILWVFFAKDIFILMGVTEPILGYCIEYVRYLSLSLIIMGAITTSESIFQGVGYTKPLIFIGIARSVLNVFLDWVLIFGNLGMPEMGLGGAALATALSDFIIVPIGFIILFKNKNIPFLISIKEIITSKWKDYKKVLKIGLPSGLEGILWHFGNLIIVRFLNMLGSNETGIYTLVMRITETPVFFYLGISRAAQTLVGNSVGRKDISTGIKDAILCTKYTLYISLVFVGLFLLFPSQVIGLFTEDISYIESSLRFFILATVWLLPKAINISVGHGIRGLGDTKWMLYSQIFGTIFVISLAAFFMFIMETGMEGVYYAILIDEVIRAGINSIRFLKSEKFSTSLAPKGSELPIPISEYIQGEE